MAQINGVQLNSSFGRDFGLLYSYVPDNNISTDAGTTVQSDKFNMLRASFRDSRSESAPQQFKNIVTNNNVGKTLDYSI